MRVGRKEIKGSFKADTWVKIYDATIGDPNFVVKSGSGNVSALVVAGGGAGGGKAYGGGGGGGGVVTIASLAVTPQSYSVVIGAGGTGVASAQGNNGGNSTFGGMTALGGGGGGIWTAGIGSAGSNGGSGGGGGGGASPTAAGGTKTQGNSGGGTGYGYDGGSAAAGGGGGGGGAGAVGSNSSTDAGANGGVGIASSISGSSLYYAAGGGGGGYGSAGTGGSSIGGNGAVYASGSPTAGVSGRGAGGGGCGHWINDDIGGRGGSGVVVISYPTGSIQATGGIITTSSGNTIHTFYGATTSITIPNLAGNTDEEYMLRHRIICGSNGGGSGYNDIGIRFNNDSATNYGGQHLGGNNTTVFAFRNTATFLYAGDAYVTGNPNLFENIIYAKSGYVRTAIGKNMAGGSTTTVNTVKIVGSSWNNTTDEVTSIVLVSFEGNTTTPSTGFGVGTSIQLWKKQEST